jgi:hypothetical protein
MIDIDISSSRSRLTDSADLERITPAIGNRARANHATPAKMCALVAAAGLVMLVAIQSQAAAGAPAQAVPNKAAAAPEEPAKPELPPRKPVRFTLIKGKGIEVCEAYRRRLNSTVFYAMPQCGRPEADAPGFTPLERVPLTDRELGRLWEPVLGLLSNNDSKYDSFDRRRHGPNVVPRSREWNVAEQVKRQRHSLAFLPEGRDPYAFQYQPRADIDNDGVDDDIVVWRSGVACGLTYHNVSLYPQISPNIIAVLDAKGAVDEPRTRTILEHPVKKRSPFGGMRSVGVALGLFEYKGTTYIEGFYDTEGDFQGRRRGIPKGAGWPDGYTNILGVFHHKAGKTSLLCELTTPYETPEPYRKPDYSDL